MAWSMPQSLLTHWGSIAFFLQGARRSADSGGDSSQIFQLQYQGGRTPGRFCFKTLRTLIHMLCRIYPEQHVDECTYIYVYIYICAFWKLLIPVLRFCLSCVLMSWCHYCSRSKPWECISRIWPATDVMMSCVLDNILANLLAGKLRKYDW